VQRKTVSAPISSTVAKRLVGWFFRNTSRMTASRAMLSSRHSPGRSRLP
jgi:hypothetical protein